MQYSIIGFVIAVMTGKFFLSQIYNILFDSNMLQENFKGEKIPIGMGLFFIPSLIIFSMFFQSYNNDTDINLILVGCILMAFVGYLDDSTVDKSNKGLKGHIKQLFKNKITTGMLKALAGFGISLYISLSISNNLQEIIINTLLISLFTNFMNLWDLRPGRATKVFILIAIIGFFLSISYTQYYFALFICLSLIYIKGDLTAKYMLGDTGSNLLGIFLGICFAIDLGFYYKIALVVFLIVMHIFAEKVSFSKIIAKNKLLNKIDMMGR